MSNEPVVLDHQRLKANKDVSPYWREKLNRTIHYFRFVYGWVEQPCTACSGSGYYDHNGSPPCGGCNGTGKEMVRGPKWYALPESYKTGDL